MAPGYQEWANYLARETGKPEPFPYAGTADPKQKLEDSMRMHAVRVRMEDSARRWQRFMWYVAFILLGLLTLLFTSIL